MTSHKRIRIGIVGCGGISGAHLPSLAKFKDRVEVVAVADIDIQKAQARAKENNVPHVCHDLDEMLRKHGKDLDAIDLLTPHQLHGPQVLACLAAGKHVLLEKPLCTTLEECRQIRISLAMHPELKVCVGYSWRFGFHEIKRAIEAGKIGTVFCAEADYSHRVLTLADWPGMEWARFRVNAGPDYGTHATDILLWLMGGEPVEVSAMGTSLAQENVPGAMKRDFLETTLFQFNFKTGAIGKVFFSSGVKVSNTGARIFGTEGTIVVNANSGTAKATIQTDAHKPPVDLPIAQGGLHPCPEEIDCFLGSIESGKYQFPICTAEEAIKDVEAFQAIELSLRTGGRVRISS